MRQSAKFLPNSAPAFRCRCFHAIIIGIVVLSRSAIAGEADSTFQEKKFFPKVPEQSVWSGDAGVNFVTAYYSFGLFIENSGVIAQPYFDLYYTLHESDGVISKATIGLELWSSIHSEKTDAQRNSIVRQWYEFDYYVPIAVTFAKRSTLTLSYFEYEFPNGAFAAARGVQANIGYDDTDIFHAFALHPHAAILYNFDGVLGLGQSDAWYAEFGVAPGFSLPSKSKYPVKISFPLTIGLGDAHFYPKDPYGYFSAAINGSMPLAFLPKSFGTWTANAGFTYYNLGDATASINANGDHNAYVGQIGVGLTF